MANTFTLADLTITHRPHPRSKSIKITVKSATEVLVTSPKRTPQRHIKKFVEQKITWIKKVQAEFVQKKIWGVTDTTVALFGHQYQKIVRVGADLPTQVVLQENTLTINRTSPHHLLSPELKKQTSDQLTTFLKKTARHYITKRTHQLAESMNLSFNTLTLKQQSSRWGSCSAQKNLNFNWKLVHCPTDVIDYVIIHELAHLTHLNHSSAFWELVETHDPNYRHHRGWLKRNGMGVA